ncbi:MAG: SMP-30/gluconolactonase/LRE family protein [Bryobacteraceae bacterium]
MASVERLDPALDRLISPDAKVEPIGTLPGFKWTEGPVWISGGYLLFAEIPSNGIYKWTPPNNVTVFMQPSGYQGKEPYGGPEPGSNGMTVDARGRLTVAGHARRSVWRMENLNGGPGNDNLTVLADSYEGKRLNSPNDLAYKSDGSLYFTDPPYGLRTQREPNPEKEQKVNGVYRIAGAMRQAPGAKPDPSKITLLISDLQRPNGIAFSPDEKYLYVDNTEPKKWMRYPMKSDGSLGTAEVLLDASSVEGVGAPDGMKVDAAGNIWSTGPGGIWIISPEGKHLGTIHVPERTGNLTFGDSDNKTLYITASSHVYKIRVQQAGMLTLDRRQK